MVNGNGEWKIVVVNRERRRARRANHRQSLSVTIHHSPFTIHHSPFTIHHSPFTIHHLPARVVLGVEALLNQFQVSLRQIEVGSRDHLPAFVGRYPIDYLWSVCSEERAVVLIK